MARKYGVKIADIKPDKAYQRALTPEIMKNNNHFVYNLYGQSSYVALAAADPLLKFTGRFLRTP
jgi:hypothetical protein